MPTYDYQCDACGHRFEQFQSIIANPLRRCPHCGKLKLKRLLSTGVGVIFKGSGFYETDYRSDSYKKAAQSDKPAAASEAKSSEKKDSKPASAETKAESKPASGKKKNAS